MTKQKEPQFNWWHVVIIFSLVISFLVGVRVSYYQGFQHGAIRGVEYTIQRVNNDNQYHLREMYRCQNFMINVCEDAGYSYPAWFNEDDVTINCANGNGVHKVGILT